MCAQFVTATTRERVLFLPTSIVRSHRARHNIETKTVSNSLIPRTKPYHVHTSSAFSTGLRACSIKQNENISLFRFRTLYKTNSFPHCYRITNATTQNRAQNNPGFCPCLSTTNKCVTFKMQRGPQKSKRTQFEESNIKIQRSSSIQSKSINNPFILETLIFPITKIQ